MIAANVVIDIPLVSSYMNAWQPYGKSLSGIPGRKRSRKGTNEQSVASATISEEISPPRSMSSDEGHIVDIRV